MFQNTQNTHAPNILMSKYEKIEDIMNTEQQIIKPFSNQNLFLTSAFHGYIEVIITMMLLTP